MITLCRWGRVERNTRLPRRGRVRTKQFWRWKRFEGDLPAFLGKIKVSSRWMSRV